jgi:hypothetical protein
VPGDDTQRDFSNELEEWLTSDQPKTLGALADTFGERSFAIAILLLMFPSAMPIPTGGITHIFEVVTIIVAVQMVLGSHTIWLPKRWRRRELGEAATGKAIPFVIRRIRWFEKFSKPRLAFLFRRRWFEQLLGLVIIAFTIGAIVAPPFSGLDTLPSLGVVVITLGILLGDPVFIAAGIVVGTGGIVLIVTLGAAAVRFFRNLF